MFFVDAGSKNVFYASVEMPCQLKCAKLKPKCAFAQSFESKCTIKYKTGNKICLVK